MREYVLVLLVGAAVTYLLTPLVRRGSIAVGALHAARDRDVHVTPTPLLGGIAMYGGMAAGLLVAERLTYLQQAFLSSRTVPGLLLAGGLLVLIGIIDDRWGVGAIGKLAGQIAAGGILVWSGVQLPWLPLPSGGIFSLEPDLSVTLTILIVVVTINAVNFIDGLDGLAAGIVAVAALSYLAYSYTLTKELGVASQSLPAVASALLAGMCLGFLPHNFNPARIFMGDTGSMLLGLLLAYGPISSTASLDPALLTNYAHAHTVNRFATALPLLLPMAILIIPYTDLMLAVIRRVKAGKSPFAADRLHLQHRLLNIGHSHRQSVLIMYLWAALFSGIVVALSIVRTGLIWLAVATIAATLVLLPATMPRLRPWYKPKPARAAQRARASVAPKAPAPARVAAPPAPAASPVPLAAPISPASSVSPPPRRGVPVAFPPADGPFPPNGTSAPGAGTPFTVDGPSPSAAGAPFPANGASATGAGVPFPAGDVPFPGPAAPHGTPSAPPAPPWA